MEVLFLLLCALLAALIYFLPAFIAFCRAHTFRWVIFVLNIFAFFAPLWIALLAWSVWPKDDFFN